MRWTRRVTRALRSRSGSSKRGDKQPKGSTVMSPLDPRSSALKLLLLVLGFPLGVAAAQRSASELQARARTRLASIDGQLDVAGLDSAVEVRRDRWGVPHIYAKTQHDLFFAQGFVAAQDRLFQMEIWRRAGEGRLAEILGPAAVERDR